MKDGFIRVGCANFEVQLGQVQKNAENIINDVKKADQQKIKVLVFPELCLTGYTIEDLFYQKRILNEVNQQLQNILEQTKDIDLFFVIGCPLVYKNQLYNCAIAIKQGHILGIVPKTYIPTYHEFYEGRHFSKALEQPQRISINGQEYPFASQLLFECQNHPALKIGIEICEDLWAPLPPSTLHCLNGATLILNPSASNNLTTKSDYRRLLVSSHSARVICGYAYCNAGLGESSTDVVFSNHHLIAENGTLLNESTQYSENIIFADMDMEKLVSERVEMTTYDNRQDDYQIIPFTLQDEDIHLTRIYDPHPFVPSDHHQRAMRCQEVFDIQIHGLIQRLKATHIKKVVIGISGGLDSTLALLVASMAYQKLGYPSRDIIAVTMPCFGTTSRTKNNVSKISIMTKMYMM